MSLGASASALNCGMRTSSVAIVDGIVRFVEVESRVKLRDGSFLYDRDVVTRVLRFPGDYVGDATHRSFDCSDCRVGMTFVGKRPDLPASSTSALLFNTKLKLHR